MKITCKFSKKWYNISDNIKKGLKEMKMTSKVLALALISSLLITGCSAKSANQKNELQSQTNQTQDLENEEVEFNTIEEEFDAFPSVPLLEFNDYSSLTKHLSSQGKKLEKLLESSNKEYISAGEGLAVVSANDTYFAYDQEYKERFNYEFNVPQLGGFGSIYFNLTKEYHRDDEINLEDAYFKMFVKTITSIDKTITEDALIKLINELKSSESSNETVKLYEDINNDVSNVVSVSVNDGKLTISCNIEQLYSLELKEITKKTYNTVSDFKNKANDYVNSTGEAYENIKLNSGPLDATYSINYDANYEGNLYEKYNFSMNYAANEAKAESENSKVRALENKIPDEIKSIMPQFVAIIKEHSGVNLTDYITIDELINIFDAYKLSDPFYTYLPIYGGSGDDLYTASITVDYVQDTSYHPYEINPAHHYLSISLYTGVKAEGKERL